MRFFLENGIVFLNWRSLTFSFLKRLITGKFPAVQWITAEEVARWLEDPVKLQPTVLDARSEAEYTVSHLKEAKRIDPDYPNLAPLAELSKDRPIIVYCSVGYRSAAVASRLVQAGFSRVYNLEGSLFQWVNSGSPVFKDGRPTLLVHPYNSLWGRLVKRRYRAQVAQVEIKRG